MLQSLHCMFFMLESNQVIHKYYVMTLFFYVCIPGDTGPSGPEGVGGKNGSQGPPGVKGDMGTKGDVGKNLRSY